MTVAAAAAALNVAPSTLHRWLNDGLIAGQQVTPGAPWHIRLTEALKAVHRDGRRRLRHHAGGHPSTGVAPDRVARVKRGEIEAAHVTKGGKRGLRIKVIEGQARLLNRFNKPEGIMKQDSK